MESEIAKWLADSYGLGLTEYYAALLLGRSPAKELRLNDLAVQIGLNQSSITRLVARMEVKGLVSKDICPDDGRGVYAVLTEAGDRLLLEIQEAYSSKLRGVIKETANTLSANGEATVAETLNVIAKFLK